MDLEQKHDNKVREISIGNGCIHVDLLSGLRLSGPLMSDDEFRSLTSKRRMIVSGSEAMGAPGPAFG